MINGRLEASGIESVLVCFTSLPTTYVCMYVCMYVCTMRIRIRIRKTYMKTYIIKFDQNVGSGTMGSKNVGSGTMWV